MIDAELVLETFVVCDQCKKGDSSIEYPDPFGRGDMDLVINAELDGFIDKGWEIEDNDALCPECVEARENEEEPLDPHRDNGGIHPVDGTGLRLFDE